MDPELTLETPEPETPETPEPDAPADKVDPLLDVAAEDPVPDAAFDELERGVESAVDPAADIPPDTTSVVEVVSGDPAETFHDFSVSPESAPEAELPEELSEAEDGDDFPPFP